MHLHTFQISHLSICLSANAPVFVNRWLCFDSKWMLRIQNRPEKNVSVPVTRGSVTCCVFGSSSSGWYTGSKAGSGSYWFDGSGFVSNQKTCTDLQLRTTACNCFLPPWYFVSRLFVTKWNCFGLVLIIVTLCLSNNSLSLFEIKILNWLVTFIQPMILSESLFNILLT